MSGENILKRIMGCKPERRRRIGRPEHKWIDGVSDDIKKLAVKNWWTVARNREAWRNFLREAKAHIGL
jgi:hypothetical protein